MRNERENPRKEKRFLAHIDVNSFYKAAERLGDITNEQRLALLCFFLRNLGTGIRAIVVYTGLSTSTVEMYIQHLALADTNSPLGKLRPVYDELLDTYRILKAVKKPETPIKQTRLTHIGDPKAHKKSVNPNLHKRFVREPSQKKTLINQT